jgi:hypothetical protein
MKRFWRTLTWGATASALLVCGLLAYATVRGRLMWFRSLQSVVITDDGKAITGSLHHSEAGPTVVLTRRLPQRTESYWIVLPGDRPGNVSSCGEWSAPGLPVFFISILTPPCFFPIKEGSGSKPSEPSDRKLVVTRSTLAFLADDGKQIQTSWK